MYTREQIGCQNPLNDNTKNCVCLEILPTYCNQERIKYYSLMVIVTFLFPFSEANAAGVSKEYESRERGNKTEF